ncbi:hypothetical protein WICPIJ_007218 [Wickerhamomyces pijperi]|uniref:Letm1 RBD domain-containing protein n=1 Tax=Wickerhamomyces pijperi TaxID=599730 RepID=A0A9P8Q233_WICPI|nr:hypothetical protein WICPIJ_007218 [Wickerhamomyces pijperi]
MSQRQFLYRTTLTLKRFQSTKPTPQAKASTVLTKPAFNELLSQNQTLHQLFHSPEPHHSIVEETGNTSNDTLNATTTLPIILRSKTAVFQQTSKENPEKQGTSLKFKQWIEYAKSIIKFYRVGIQNTWRNRKLVKAIKAKYAIVDLQGPATIHRQIRNSNDVIEQLSTYLSLKKIEANALKANLKPPTESVVNITRRELSLIKRTEPDIWKLPVFTLVLLICGEMTPFVVYAFPHLTPRTCISSGVLQSLNSKNNAKFNKKEIKITDIYKLPRGELILMSKLYFLIPNFFTFFPITYYQKRLALHHSYLKVDDYYLKSVDRETQISGLWNLSKSELIRANLDRNLIDLSVTDVEELKADELKVRLFYYLGLEEGRFSYQDIQKIRNLSWDESHNIMKWRHSLANEKLEKSE